MPGFPEFDVPPPPRTLMARPTPFDPIHTAIECHRAAYDAYQIASEGRASLIANDDYDATTDALVATACATRFGALALLAHLRWWLGEEAAFSAGHQPAYGLAQTRAADLTLFLGTNLPPVSIPLALPQGRLLPPLAMQHRAAAASRRPDTASVQAGRHATSAGELLAAVAIIAGGSALVGLASMI